MTEPARFHRPPARRPVARYLYEQRHTARESYGYGVLANPGMPWGPWGPHDGIDYHGYAAGYLAGQAGQPAARKDGGNWPLVTSEQDLQNSVGLARVLYDTNYLVSGAVQRLADFVLGDRATWQITLKGAKPGPVWTGDTEPDPAVMKCQAVLDAWCELAQWGTGPGVNDPADPDDDVTVLHDRRREAFERWRVDGEFFLRFFVPRPGDLPPVRWVEPALVGSGETTGPTSFGVVTDPADAERITEYRTRTAEGQQDDPVPAGRVVHLKANVPATVKRGLSDFFAAGEDFTRALDILRSMGTVAKLGNDVLMVRQHAPGTSNAQITAMVEAGKDFNAPRLAPAGGGNAWTPVTQSRPGTVVDIKHGMEMIPPPALVNLAGGEQTVQAVLRGLSRKYGMDEGLISGDASNNNMASMLIAGGPFERAAKSFQRAFGMGERAIAYKVLAFAAASGADTPFGRLTAADVRAVEVQVVYPSVTIANKLEDTQRLQILVRDIGLDKQTALAEQGYDPAQVAANKAAWDEQFPDPGQATGGLFGGDDFGDDDGDGVPDDTDQSDDTTQEGVLAEGVKTGVDRRGRKWKTVDGVHVSVDGGIDGPTASREAAGRTRTAWAVTKTLAAANEHGDRHESAEYYGPARDAMKNAASAYRAAKARDRPLAREHHKDAAAAHRDAAEGHRGYAGRDVRHAEAAKLHDRAARGHDRAAAAFAQPEK